ncbi:MAG: hypothetical protein ACRYE9_04360 [Janthinobacterium lividum]
MLYAKQELAGLYEQLEIYSNFDARIKDNQSSSIEKVHKIVEYKDPSSINFTKIL